ncbi:hypothetical protein M5K25_023420 [Dendrobium thyrsiflorum]|uniref:Uncharacterized protein n=1 Tax=Dendrobium thyrsiflorum TaxID=117978 RepID=A0ABD0UF21_DENTH
MEQRSWLLELDVGLRMGSQVMVCRLEREEENSEVLACMRQENDLACALIYYSGEQERIENSYSIIQTDSS